MSSEPSKTQGHTESLLGSAKEMLGSTISPVAPETGTNLQQSGASQHAKGETEVKAAQTQGYVEGLTDKVEGKYHSIAGAVKSDEPQKQIGQAKEVKGELKKNINNPTT
ncbi:hypothetical protein OC846_002441 [Tilletia horrida]|uniref:CsbD-like domain-containing protein n=1 Tax=Tilletia horrida TaxID=155126 RepID=A0AAN6JYX0_9BASI|nr:hypothetical protein OC845_001968 [Tilletia horrida]KAK0553600.1 hypothetical protein OC846_002441 [Tilletia horrida]KAK0567550.1 hypothetical protein OC861_002671 [Tilletia horrida]